MVIVNVFTEKEVEERMASRVVCSILECFNSGRNGRKLREARKTIAWCRFSWYFISWTIMRRLSVGLVMLALYVVPDFETPWNCSYDG